MEPLFPLLPCLLLMLLTTTHAFSPAFRTTSASPTHFRARSCRASFEGSSWSSSSGCGAERMLGTKRRERGSGSQVVLSSLSQPDEMEAFFEEQSKKGQEKIKQMTVEQRARSAMVALGIEDEIYKQADLLVTTADEMERRTGKIDREVLQPVVDSIQQLKARYAQVVTGQADDIF